MFEFRPCGKALPTDAQSQVAPLISAIFAEWGWEPRDYAMACTGDKGQYSVNAWKGGERQIQAWINRDGTIKAVKQVGDMWHQTENVTNELCDALAHAIEQTSVEQQILEDTCLEHGTFCCALCFPIENVEHCSKHGTLGVYCDKCEDEFRSTEV